MQSDDELCLCFHVTKRKVASYLRLEKPRRVSQLAQCYGAGTGCGWCRPFLRQMFDAVSAGDDQPELPAAEKYTSGRSSYVKSGKGTPPPGATPVD